MNNEVKITYCPPGRAAGCTFDPWQFYYAQNRYGIRHGPNGFFRDGYKPDSDNQGFKVSFRNYSKITPKKKKISPWRKGSYVLED